MPKFMFPRKDVAVQRPPVSEELGAAEYVPSAATFFYFSIVDRETQAVIRKKMSSLKGELLLRDGPRIQQINRAQTAEEVLDLTPLATGLGANAWQKRIEQFGPEILPLIAERLRKAKRIKDEMAQDLTYEQLLGELRWRGDAGADVLMAVFDDLDLYGRCLACIVLGLLGRSDAGDRMLKTYYAAIKKTEERLFVGPLWGLVLLRDERAARVLADEALEGKRYYELFGFLALVGDETCVYPLLTILLDKDDPNHDAADVALTSIVHRIGKQAFVDIFEDPGPSYADLLTKLADRCLATPMSEVEDFFSLFYPHPLQDDNEKAAQP